MENTPETRLARWSRELRELIEDDGGGTARAKNLADAIDREAQRIERNRAR
jgi:hypothetical protein